MAESRDRFRIPLRARDLYRKRRARRQRHGSDAFYALRSPYNPHTPVIDKSGRQARCCSRAVIAKFAGNGDVRNIQYTYLCSCARARAGRRFRRLRNSATGESRVKGQGKRLWKRSSRIIHRIALARSPCTLEYRLPPRVYIVAQLIRQVSRPGNASFTWHSAICAISREIGVLSHRCVSFI